MHRVIRPALLCFLLLIVLPMSMCSPPPHKGLFYDLQTGPLQSRSAHLPITAHGTLAIVHNNEMHEVDFWTEWHSDSNFSIEMYGPFGVVVVGLYSDSTGFWSESGTDKKKIDLDKPVDVARDIMRYAMSGRDIVRIMSGRLPEKWQMTTRPDSVQKSDTAIGLFWHAPNGVLITQKAIHGKPYVAIESKNPAWTMNFSRFDRYDFAHLIRFSNSFQDSFELKIKKITVEK